MNTQIIDNPDSLNAVRENWTRLEGNATLPMQEFIWAQACATEFTREGELHTLAVEDGGGTVAIAPLVRYNGRPCLEMLGVAETHEPTDVIGASPAALDALATAMRNQGTPLYLRRVPADSPLLQALQKAFRGRGVMVCRPDGGWPWLPLDPRWVEPESQLNSGRRSDFRRAKRIADEMGTVTSEIVAPVPSTLTPLLEEAIAVEAASWKGEAKTAVALDPVRGAFYRRYVAAACEKGILRLCFLRIGGQAAAMQIAVEYDSRLWLLKIGYDSKFARCSPGVLLLRETLRYAAIRGLKSLEFLGTVEPWIRVWTQMEKSCVVIRGYPLGLRGVTALAGDILKSAGLKLGLIK